MSGPVEYEFKYADKALKVLEAAFDKSLESVKEKISNDKNDKSVGLLDQYARTLKNSMLTAHKLSLGQSQDKLDAYNREVFGRATQVLNGLIDGSLNEGEIEQSKLLAQKLNQEAHQSFIAGAFCHFLGIAGAIGSVFLMNPVGALLLTSAITSFVKSEDSYDFSGEFDEMRKTMDAFVGQAEELRKTSAEGEPDNHDDTKTKQP